MHYCCIMLYVSQTCVIKLKIYNFSLFDNQRFFYVDCQTSQLHPKCRQLFSVNYASNLNKAKHKFTKSFYRSYYLKNKNNNKKIAYP